jgi:hypothetical protein
VKKGFSPKKKSRPRAYAVMPIAGSTPGLVVRNIHIGTFGHPLESGSVHL